MIKIFKSLKKINHLKAYSLLEVLVTLLIVNIILLMVSQILVISLRLSVQAQERSFAREELTNIINLIKADIRNADNLMNDCTNSNSCTLMKTSAEIMWHLCDANNDGVDDQICKDNITSGNTEYISNEKLIIDPNTFSFLEVSSGGAGGNIRDRISILITISADHRNEDLEITNLYRQVIISTRNFYI
ncbi:hypothetical protein GF362_05210 [Candidatus Dojkabacteria bacterium]|nr:hypothetical protein [Candidatus Dojkabacteria bacterium]